MQLLDGDDVPPPRTVATRVEPRALRAIRKGHPWVFAHSIRSQRPVPEPGDLAVIFDDRRRFVGIGLADPGASIAVRMLHHGSPRDIDAGFFADRVDEAVTRRQPLLDDPATTGVRLIHGENDQLPGLIVDCYDDVVVVKMYTTAWERHLSVVLGAVAGRLPVRSIVVRASRAVQREWSGLSNPGWRHDGALVDGEELTGPVPFLENGLTFEAAVQTGHKTGYFLDQRDNRQRVRDLARGGRVLDVFASSGGFSAHAAAGGAIEVTSVDISSAALAAAERHVAANAGRTAHQVLVGDAFEVLDRLRRDRRRFDVVILDPPSFAGKSADVPAARRAYRRLTRAGLDVLAPGGTLVQASCSARVSESRFQEDVQAELTGWSFEHIEQTGHPIDHPVGFPEGGYLKALFARNGRQRTIR